jgi:serine/threonine-protein kinase
MQSWSKIKSKLSGNSSPKFESSECVEKICPACNRTYAKPLVVCKHDGTLLIRVSFPHLRLANFMGTDLAESRYKMQGFLGEGDLTMVFNAFDIETKASVVIKVIKSQMLGDIRRLRRFAKTLEETVGLKHERIAEVLNVAITRDTNRAHSIPQLFMVTEKLDGISLKRILTDFGILAPYVVIESMIQVCETLAYAANIGWLHKDLKPSNIYLSVKEDQLMVKICDFGVATRLFSNLEWESKGTKTGSLYGNAAYMCPDVMFGHEHAVTSEIYSLGCVMYHVLKGMPPFEGMNDFGTLMQHRDAEARPFAAELKIPAELEAVVLRCLQKQPEQRYQNFDDLATALNAIKTISAG